MYRGRRFRTTIAGTKGFQLSPFKDGTQSGTNVMVDNRDAGTKVEYALLVPYVIERYGFYEGKGIPYRVEPAKVLEVFDFLKAKKR